MFRITLPRITDPRGNLTFIENGSALPFQIRRVFWMYDVPGGQKRGGHAYRQQEELIIPLSGSFDVVVHDGDTPRIYRLNRSYEALYLPSLTWRHIENFSTNALSLHLSSASYSATDYIRNFEDFLELKRRAE